MRIDEHEEAMKAFGAARKERPRDAAVANRVGQALVVTHEYRKAVEHYEDALVTVKESPAKLELLYSFGGSIFVYQLFDCGVSLTSPGKIECLLRRSGHHKGNL